MKTLINTALGLSSFLAVMASGPTMTAVASANAAARTYVACNKYGECWRVRQRYAYGPDAPIVYYNSDWYEAHRTDERIKWLADPENDRGYYVQGEWHADPAARALTVGAAGAGIGAAIGCLVTLPVGCAPGAAVGAAVGGGGGAVAGAASAHN